MGLISPDLRVDRLMQLRRGNNRLTGVQQLHLHQPHEGQGMAFELTHFSVLSNHVGYMHLSCQNGAH